MSVDDTAAYFSLDCSRQVLGIRVSQSLLLYVSCILPKPAYIMYQLRLLILFAISWASSPLRARRSQLQVGRLMAQGQNSRSIHFCASFPSFSYARHCKHFQNLEKIKWECQRMHLSLRHRLDCTTRSSPPSSMSKLYKRRDTRKRSCALPSFRQSSEVRKEKS
eukprot:3719906-Pleurochrysis_carterae.AAC.1